MAKGLGVVLGLVMCAGAWAQDKGAAAEKPVLETLYLTNASERNQANELMTGIRLMLDPSVKLYLTPSQSAITIKATPSQIAEAKLLLSQLDRPTKSYRVTYTLEEMDAGKRVGEQHISLVAVNGTQAVMKQGQRVPIKTGSTETESKTLQTQMTYLDVGLNVDAWVDQFEGGVRLRTTVEQSSVAPDQLAPGVENPVVRQTKLVGSAMLTLGRTVALGSLDLPGSTRHLEVSVVVEPVK
jgi:type II secretory pathway component GspD/PulD (secretin)